MKSNFKALCWVSLVAFATPPAAAQRSQYIPPQSVENPALWFSMEDYPIAARRAGEQGRVIVQLYIDAAGTVTRCAVVTSSESRLLDEATCALALKRGRFRPAVDRSKRPVASSFLLPVRWALEDAEQELANMTAIVEIDVSAAGKVIACRQIEPQVKPEQDACNDEISIDDLIISTLRHVEKKSGLTLKMSHTFHLGENPTHEQLIPGHGYIIADRLVKVVIDSLGNVRQCVPLKSLGLSTMDCTDGLGKFAPKIGPDGKATTATVFIGTSIVARPLIAKTD